MGMSMEEMAKRAEESEITNGFIGFLEYEAEVARSDGVPSIGDTLDGVAKRLKELHNRCNDYEEENKQLKEDLQRVEKRAKDYKWLIGHVESIAKDYKDENLDLRQKNTQLKETLQKSVIAHEAALNKIKELSK